MSQQVIAVVGLSGVGKTTALKSLSEKRSFQHLGASRLISEARQLRDTLDALATLRTVDIDENQQLLILGFQRAIDTKAAHVVLDGHSVVETAAGLVTIDPAVFRELKITSMVFLADQPNEILRRRASDVTRNRAVATKEVLHHHQEAALLAAFRICLNLDISLSVVSMGVGQADHLESSIFGNRL